MKKPIYIAAVAALIAFPAYAGQTPSTFDHVKTGFAQAIDGISGWFGKDNADISNLADITPAAGEANAIPSDIDPADIEPAAGYDADTMQVPPPYATPVSNALPRASAFDNIESMAAFGGPIASPDELDSIATAAGDDMGCEIEADEQIAAQDEGEVNACQHKAQAQEDLQVAPVQEKSPAQPAFEPEPFSGDLPETRPAAGE